MKLQVYCPTCETWLTNSETIFLNIEEDIQGYDVVTFQCKYCEEEHESYVR